MPAQDHGASSLAATEAQLRSIIDGVYDHAISLLDPEGRILTWNSAAERLKGYTLAEVRGRHFRMLFTPEDRESGLPERELEVAAREGRWKGEGWRLRKDGTQFPAEVSVSALRGPDGALTGFVKVTQDVTARRAAEEALRVSQARYETTLRSIGDAVIATDGEGRVSFMNPVAEALTGYTNDESHGQPLTAVFRIINEYSRATVENPVDRVLREGVVVGLANHTALIARDGSERSIADSGAPIFDSERRVVGVVLVFRDVTAERDELARERLLAAATEEFARSLDYEATLANIARRTVPSLADWCTVELLDSNGTLRPLEVAHGDPEKVRWAREFVARYPTDMASPVGSPQVVRTGAAVLIEDVPDEAVVASARDPEHLELLRGLGFRSYIGVPLVARGRVLGVLSLIATAARPRYTSTDLAFAEELGRRAGLAIDNAQLYRAAQEASQLKDEFLATISHELRTPLTAIVGWTRMLRTGVVAAARRGAALETIDRNAAAQVRLIDDLLDVSRIITGKLQLDLTPTEPGHAIELAVEAMRPAAEAKGVRLEARLEPHFASTILADADRLQQIVWNLTSNAVKFTPSGGRVLVHLRREGPDVVIEVEDTGQGIVPAFLPHVFERFRQADASHSRAHGGLGLGLAITRHLVELHGGSIHVASPGEGQGATFTVRLPAAPDERATPRIEPRPPTPATGSPAAAPLEGLDVLLVEDDADAREMVAAVLTSAGAAVETVGSVGDALAAFDRRVPHLLVSDIGLPGQDGYALIRQVRALPPERGGRVPALALTAYARGTDRARALTEGFDDHVTKPVDPGELAAIAVELARRAAPRTPDG